MFPSNWCYPHSGQPVTEGKKRVAVTWYYVDGNFNKKKKPDVPDVPDVNQLLKDPGIIDALKSGGFSEMLGMS